MYNYSSLIQKLTERKLIYLLALLGCVLGFISNYIQHGWLNADSLIYFESARLISIGEWKQSVSLFGWPLYAALLAFAHNLTGLSIQYCAQLWNVIFFTITVFSFNTLIQLAGGKKLTMICGTFLLFSSSYISGSVLPMLLRDQGFWAAYLTSAVFFISFYRTQKTIDALLWQISAMFAVLFRIEAISFLALLPLLLLVNQSFTIKQRLRLFVTVNFIPVLGLLCLLFILSFTSYIHLSDLGRLQEIFNFVGTRGLLIAQNFSQKGLEMGKLLGLLLDDYGLFGFTVALIAIFIAKIMKLISFSVIGIYIIAHKQAKSLSIPWSMKKDTQTIFFTLIAISAINAFISITSTLCLSSRYVISLGFIAFIFGAFCLEQLICRKNLALLKRHHAYSLILLIIIAVLTVSLINNFKPKQVGYNHEKEAVDYIRAHQINLNAVYYSTAKTNFYAGRPYSADLIKKNDIWKNVTEAIENGSIYKYPYLLIYVDIDDSIKAKELLLSSKLADYKLEQEFFGYKHKKKLMLYVKQP